MYKRREVLKLLGTLAAGGIVTACTKEQPAEARPNQAIAPRQSDFHYQSIREIARKIEAGEISPVEMTRMMLERIEALDGQLKIYATVTADRAMASARKA